MGLNVSNHNKKVAVYGVAKNEEANILGWYNSISDADEIFLLDTGSTDKTVEIALSLGINVNHVVIDPWNETLAKNIAVSQIPIDIDYCINLDLDQYIATDNWKEILLSSGDSPIFFCKHLYTNGIEDNNVISKIPSIHTRKDILWVGYRPRPFHVSENIVDYEVIEDIVICEKPGNNDRFENRELLYIKSFKNHLLFCQEMERSEDLLYSLANLALSHYEANEYLEFSKYFNVYFDKTDAENVQERLLYATYFLLLSKAIISNKDGYKYYDIAKKIMINNPGYRIFAILKKAILSFILNDKDTMSECINEINSIEWGMVGNHQNFVVTDSLGQCMKELTAFINDSSHNINIELLIDVYSNIGWGKRHLDLAESCFRDFL